MTGYVYVGESTDNFTKGKIYPLRPDHSLDCVGAFSDNSGDANGFWPNNPDLFKPVDDIKNEQPYLHYQITFFKQEEGNSEHVVKLYSIKENESLEERINKEIKDNTTLKLRQVIVV